MDFEKLDLSVHDDPEQVKRIVSSRKISSETAIVNAEKRSCIISGSSEIPYHVTLSSCTCGDFISRHLPCKHMYFLAGKLGVMPELPIFDSKAKTPFDPEAEISRYLIAYKAGEISGEKFSKIADVLRKGK